ncbi:hypothetical protein GCM10010298_48150 [Streptomyces microflavus]|nr:hypothetical protein GCM10010298_48150 [Streptomyces microflavus]
MIGVSGGARHRPLARWVARLGTDGSVPATYRVTGRVNDGAERTDARVLPLFQDPAWRRTSLPARRDEGSAVTALALQHSVHGIAYAELDDYGRPLPASAEGAQLVGRIEELWDAPPAEPEVLRVLAGEGLDLRHVLLHRLGDETEPPPALFHTLPWNDLEAVAGNVLTMLGGAGPVERPRRELRHWLTPAATRLAGPLAILERGMREGRDPVMLRYEAASLLTGLLTVRPERIPQSTARQLAQVAEQLSTRDPLLRHTARVVAKRLHTDRTQVRIPSLALRLDSVLPPAARMTGASHIRTITDGLFVVQAEHTPGGQVRVTVTLPKPADGAEGAWAADTDDLVAPLTLRSAERMAAPFWIALRVRESSLLGSLELFSPQGRFELVADEPPVPFAALRTLSATDLLPSLRASSTATVRLWKSAATVLPAEHPVPEALRLYRQDPTR